MCSSLPFFIAPFPVEVDKKGSRAFFNSATYPGKIVFCLTGVALITQGFDPLDLVGDVRMAFVMVSGYELRHHRTT